MKKNLYVANEEAFLESAGEIEACYPGFHDKIFGNLDELVKGTSQGYYMGWVKEFMGYFHPNKKSTLEKDVQFKEDLLKKIKNYEEMKPELAMQNYSLMVLSYMVKNKHPKKHYYVDGIAEKHGLATLSNGPHKIVDPSVILDKYNEEGITIKHYGPSEFKGIGGENLVWGDSSTFVELTLQGDGLLHILFKEPGNPQDGTLEIEEIFPGIHHSLLLDHPDITLGFPYLNIFYNPGMEISDSYGNVALNFWGCNQVLSSLFTPGTCIYPDAVMFMGMANSLGYDPSIWYKKLLEVEKKKEDKDIPKNTLIHLDEHIVTSWNPTHTKFPR